MGIQSNTRKEEQVRARKLMNCGGGECCDPCPFVGDYNWELSHSLCPGDKLSDYFDTLIMLDLSE